MEIIEYFESENKQKWTEEIRKMDWGAAKFLAELLTENRFANVLGEGGKLYLMIDGDKLVSFITLTHQDCIADESLFPWLGFLFTVPEYRGHRYSEKIIEHAVSEAQKQGYDKIYLGTDHVGLYEKYGFSYTETRMDVWGGDCRIYVKNT